MTMTVTHRDTKTERKHRVKQAAKWCADQAVDLAILASVVKK